MLRNHIIFFFFLSYQNVSHQQSMCLPILAIFLSRQKYLKWVQSLYTVDSISFSVASFDFRPLYITKFSKYSCAWHSYTYGDIAYNIWLECSCVNGKSWYFFFHSCLWLLLITFCQVKKPHKVKKKKIIMSLNLVWSNILLLGSFIVATWKQ